MNPAVMEFNFTDVRLGRSIAPAMTPYETPSSFKNRLRAWLARAAAALSRAQQHVADNIRVPPGGG